MTKQDVITLFLRTYPEGSQGAALAFDEAYRELLSFCPDLSLSLVLIPVQAGQARHALPAEALHIKAAVLASAIHPQTGEPEGGIVLRPATPALRAIQGEPFPSGTGQPSRYWLEPSEGVWRLVLDRAPQQAGLTLALKGTFYTPLLPADPIPAALPSADALLALMKAKHARDFHPQDAPMWRAMHDQELQRLHDWLAQRQQGEAQELLPSLMLNPRPIY